MTDKFFSKLTTAVALLSSGVAAHGYIQGIIADDVYYQGYRPSFQYLSNPPQVAGWSDPENLSNGYISDYTSPDIICNLGATPGQTYATVEAGGTVELQWTPWPTGHLGPVLSYLANCNGECTDVDKTQLLFNKIDEAGLLEGGTTPGKWASAELAANNNSWTLQIPSEIAPGNYVLRHEIIALQQAMTEGGAQNYPMCVNLQVTGSGTDSLQNGTLGTALYQASDPGLFINIYQDLTNYTIPGPPMIDGATDIPQPTVLTSATATATIVYGSASATVSFSNTTTSSSPSTVASTSLSTTATTSSFSLSTNTTSGPSVITVTVTESAAATSGVSSTTTASSSSSSTSTSFTGTISTTTAVPLVFATVPTSVASSSSTNSSVTLTSITASLGSFPTTFQTFTISNFSTSFDTSTSAEPTSTSTDLVTFTVTVPGVFAAPSTLTAMSSFSTATVSAGGFYPMTNGTSWNGTAWSTGAALPSGTAWSTGAAWPTGGSWTVQPTGTGAFWSSMTTETAAPIDNGYKFKRSMRIVRRST